MFRTCFIVITNHKKWNTLKFSLKNMLYMLASKNNIFCDIYTQNMLYCSLIFKVSIKIYITFGNRSSRLDVVNITIGIPFFN